MAKHHGKKYIETVYGGTSEFKKKSNRKKKKERKKKSNITQELDQSIRLTL